MPGGLSQELTLLTRGAESGLGRVGCLMSSGKKVRRGETGTLSEGSLLRVLGERRGEGKESLDRARFLLRLGRRLRGAMYREPTLGKWAWGR